MEQSGSNLSDDCQAKLQASWKEADRNRNNKVEFEEFALWYSSRGFNQELLLTPQALQDRILAKKYGLSAPEVDHVRTKFKEFDEDKSGAIDFDEFQKLMHKLMKAPDELKLPE